MKFIKPIAGGTNITPNMGVQKNDALSTVKPKLGMFGFGFSAKAGTAVQTGFAGYSTTVPEALINKFANIDMPKTKPTQLQISDADYMPDKQYADAEV